MLTFGCSGTLGDTYLQVLKLKTYGDVPIQLYHYTVHEYWHLLIRKIYSLLPNVSVEFINYRDTKYPVLTSDLRYGKVDFYPNFKIDLSCDFVGDYVVIQAHSGKDVGYNCKELSIEYIQSIVDLFNIHCVLIGTKEKYKDIKRCTNLIGIPFMNVFDIVSTSQFFIAPEGLFSFVALSNKVKSVIFYTDQEAMDSHIIGTPWEEDCVLVKDKVIEINKLREIIML